MAEKSTVLTSSSLPWRNSRNPECLFEGGLIDVQGLDTHKICIPGTAVSMFCMCVREHVSITNTHPLWSAHTAPLSPPPTTSLARPSLHTLSLSPRPQHHSPAHPYTLSLSTSPRPQHYSPAHPYTHSLSLAPPPPTLARRPAHNITRPPIPTHTHSLSPRPQHHSPAHPYTFSRPAHTRPLIPTHSLRPAHTRPLIHTHSLTPPTLARSSIHILSHAHKQGECGHHHREHIELRERTSMR